MARKYTKTQRKKYQAAQKIAQREQAKIVADRLLGKKPAGLFSPDADLVNKYAADIVYRAGKSLDKIIQEGMGWPNG